MASDRDKAVQEAKRVAAKENFPTLYMTDEEEAVAESSARFAYDLGFAAGKREGTDAERWRCIEIADDYADDPDPTHSACEAALEISDMIKGTDDE